MHLLSVLSAFSAPSLFWNQAFLSEPHVGCRGETPRTPAVIPPCPLLYQLVPKHKRKVQPRKTSAMTATRRPGEAKEKGHKKPRETKKDTPNSSEMKKGPRKAREAMMGPTKPAKEKAPKKGSQTRDQEARLSEAKKASQQPDKATQALPSATGPRGKPKVTGRRSNQGRCVSGLRGGPGDRGLWQPLDGR